MTCICGIERDGIVCIGGDSAAVSGYDRNLRETDGKVFVNGPMLFGFTTSFRMGDLLRYSLVVPPHKRGVEDRRYLVTTFVDALRDVYRSKGYMRRESEQESAGVFLLGYHGKLYHVDSDFQVGHCSEGYGAVGCGQAYALGVLHYVTHNEPELCSEDMIHAALSAAACHSTGVAAPFSILSIGEKPKPRNRTQAQKRRRHK